MTPSRRAFTLLEVLLALTIGVMIVFSVTSVLVTISRQDAWARARLETTADLSISHMVFERAFGRMVMAEGQPPREDEETADDRGITDADEEAEEAEDEADETAEDGSEEEDAEAEEDEAPRFLLVYDRSQPASMPYREQSTLGTDRFSMRYPQRLEIAVSAAPVRAPRIEQAALQPRSPWARADALERATEADAEILAQAESTGGEVVFNPGARGAFELTFEPDGQGGSWTLWWRPIAGDDADLMTELAPVGLFEEDALVTSRGIRLADGLRNCYWQVYRSEEFLDEAEAYWTRDLPAYITVHLETVTGIQHEWMFETGWSSGPEPGAANVVGGEEGEIPAEDAESGQAGEETDRGATGNSRRGAGNRSRGSMPTGPRRPGPQARPAPSTSGGSGTSGGGRP